MAPTGPTGVTASSISGNHGHSATITAAQLNSDVDIELNIRGTSDHPHTVSITAAELDRIMAGNQVGKESSNDDGHTHFVTFN